MASGMEEGLAQGTVLTVRNTFIEEVDVQEQNTVQSLRRSASDSQLSQRSHTSSSSSFVWTVACRHLDSSQSSERSEQSFVVDGLQEFRAEDGQGTFGEGPSSASLIGRERPAARNPGALVLTIHEETGLPIETLVELDESGVLAQIPRNDSDGRLSSIGSIEKHDNGTCSPCIFWFRGDCTNNILCNWCHFRHAGQKTKRFKPNKRTREARRASMKQLDGEENEEEENADDSVSGDTYTKGTSSSPWPATAVTHLLQ